MRLILTFLCFFLSGLVGFGNAGSVEAAGVDVDARTITTSLYQEPRILDSTSAPTVEFTAEILAHIQEGLLRLDGRGQLAPGVAVEWEMTDEQLRFQLRPDARWSDGTSVTAHDFVFAWRKLVTPATGSPSANLASPIRNALAVLRGELPPAALGVHAASDNELIVDLAHPCGWCVKMMTSSAFYPINKAFYDQAGEAYGTSPSTLLSNGPFRLNEWQRGKRLRLAKNPAYWGHERVGLNGIHYDYLASDTKSLLNLFRTGETAITSLDRDTMVEGTRLGQRIRNLSTGYLMHLQFSHLPSRITSNQHLRAAIALAIDKDELVNRVIGIPGTQVADAMFHRWLRINETTAGAVLSPEPARQDRARARELVALARRELGIEGPIPLSFTIYDSANIKRIAEYVQRQLGQVGIEVRIDAQTVAVLLDKWFKGNGDMFLVGWLVDVNDPIDQISFMGNPDIRKVFRGLYPGEDMTRIYFDYRDARTDEARLDAFRRADALFREKTTVVPLYESFSATLIDSRMQGYLFQRVRAFNDYRYVRLRSSD